VSTNFTTRAGLAALSTRLVIARFEQAVCDLHCFQAKTQATSKQDIEIADAPRRGLALAETAGLF
jgi:phage-related protein